MIRLTQRPGPVARTFSLAEGPPGHLARAGFQVEQLFAGYDRSAFGSIYPGELVFVARKSPTP